MASEYAWLSVLALAARMLGALVFGTALWSKLRNFDEFVSIVARYLVAPLGLARIAAIVIAILEGAVVLLLLAPSGGLVGGALAIGLLLGFAGAMALALLRGEHELDCGCMSSALRQRVRPALVVRNLLLVACLVPLLAPHAGVAGALAAMDGLAAGAVLFVLNLAFGALVALDDSFADLKRRYG